MKILIVSINYAPEPTATGKYTGEMAEWFALKGHEVSVIAAPPHYPRWEVSSDFKGKGFWTHIHRGVLVHRVPCYIPPIDKLSGTTRILMEISFSLFSIRYWLPIFFSQRKYDVVLAICPPMQTALFPWFYQKVRNVPYVFHVQDFQVDMAFRLKMLKPNFFSKTLYSLETKFIKSASRVSTITSAMQKRAIQKGAEEGKMIFFPNWSDIEYMKPGERYNKFREELGYSVDDFLVIYSGGMGVKQGLDVIIRAAEITKNHKSIKYLICGDGEAKQNLIMDVEEKGLVNTKFLSLQPFEKVPELLAASNVNLAIQKASAADLVMPSKLTNILAAGRAVIATAKNSTGLADVIIENNVGLVCSPENAEELAQKVLELFGNPALVELMGINSRKYAECFLDKEVILAQFEKDIKSLGSF